MTGAFLTIVNYSVVYLDDFQAITAKRKVPRECLMFIDPCGILTCIYSGRKNNYSSTIQF